MVSLFEPLDESLAYKPTALLVARSEVCSRVKQAMKKIAAVQIKNPNIDIQIDNSVSKQPCPGAAASKKNV